MYKRQEHYTPMIDELAVDEDMKQHLIMKLLEELPHFSISSGGPEVLDTLFADAAAYAQAHGLNALFLDVADAELSSIAFRDRAYETWPGAAADDSLFHKYDPLRALCEHCLLYTSRCV